MMMEDYMTYIDSLYYKVWSDSSWEKFNNSVKINNIVYVTVINSDGVEYYYSILGYAGFKPYGESLILFDKPVPTLPDTLLFNYTYKLETTFYYQGYNYTMTYNETLLDTVSVAVAFGIFNPCLWFKSKFTLSAGGQSESLDREYWLAKGPGNIKLKQDNGVIIVMVRGIVNGQSWGMPLEKHNRELPIYDKHITLMDIKRHFQLKLKM